MKILMTAFDAFGGDSVNASSKALDALFVPEETAALIKIKLPTVFGKSVSLLKDEIKKHMPDAVLCIGQAAGRTAVTAERVAVNLIDADIEDNEGFKPVDVPVEVGAPAAYFATVPVKNIVKAIREEGIPAEISYTAGTYVCNQLFYGALHYVSVNLFPVRVGFIHVPKLCGQICSRSDDSPGMELRYIVKALEIAVRETAQAGYE